MIDGDDNDDDDNDVENDDSGVVSSLFATVSLTGTIEGSSNHEAISSVD